MANYVIFDENKNYFNTIICEEHDWLPVGYTKLLIPEGYFWNETELVKAYTPKIEIQTI